MNGVSDFWLLIIFFVIFVIVVSINDHLKGKKKKKSQTNRFESTINFYSRIFWFRDYWSNRNRLGRNKKTEGLGWRDKEDFNIETLTENEINAEKAENHYFKIRDLDNNKLFTGLTDPYKLIQQYEPLNVVVSSFEDFGADLQQLPHDTVYNVDQSMGSKMASQYKDSLVKTIKVFTEKLAAKKERSMFTTYVTFPFCGIFIIAIVAIVLRFLFNLLPFLNLLYLPTILMVSILYIYLIIRDIVHENTKHIKSAVAFIELYNGKDPKFHFRVDGDIPDWLDEKPYWIFNYVYEWPGELTVKKGLPPIHFKKDYERIQLWVDSKTGIVEWGVTDYHYRELWYKFEPDVEDVLVWIFPNFHTPRFLNIRTKDEGELKDLYIDGAQMKQKWKDHVEKKIELHKQEWVKPQIALEETASRNPIKRIITSNIAKLWWDRWRYPLGADNENYIYKPKSLDKKVYPVVGKQPDNK